MNSPLSLVVGQRILSRSPMLSSQPSDRTRWTVSKIRSSSNQSERLLFEETGRSIIGVANPYGKEHISSILSEMTGAEVIGGPYLHMTLTTNFTQFGETKLFEKTPWDRAFLRYARIYRPPTRRSAAGLRWPRPFA